MKRALPYILIIIVLLLAAGFYLDSHKPSTRENKTSMDLGKNQSAELDDYGSAPDFVGISHWLNTDKPISIADLKGKVVLVDFWTYSCINCIRTLPYVTKWYDTYKDNGLVVIGVHTPEFTAEKVTENVQQAIDQFKIHYPVAQDNDYRTWNAYRSDSWPAEYIIDKTGKLVHVHVGEGDYVQTENLIRQLLGMDAATGTNDAMSHKPQSPEMYFGLKRLEYFAYKDTPSDQPTTFVIPNFLDLHKFALEGTWQFTPETVNLTKDGGKIKLHFQGSKVYMVAESAPAQSIVAKVDNFDPMVVQVSNPMLYTVFNSDSYGEHTLEITVPKAGFKGYTFTFGQ